MRNLIIGFILGGAAGSGLTYIIFKRKFTREYWDKFQGAVDDRVDYEIANVREYYENERHKNDTPAANSQDDQNTYNNITKDYRSSEGFSRIEMTEPDIIEQTEREEIVQKTLEENRPKCKILSEDSFGEIDGYETETLRYFVQDKFLVHEDGTIVDEPHDLLDDALDRYGWADDDSDDSEMFVRNYGLQRDYEVVKEFDEWKGNE